MATLHLIFSRSGYAACTERCLAGDTLVLLQDGVYAPFGDRPVLALGSDVIARGMSDRLDTTRCIDMTELVNLTTRHQPIVSWR